MNNPVSTLDGLIYNLKSLRGEDSYLVRSIGNFDLLISALNELNSMVELNSLKDSIVKQLKFLLINQSYSSDKSGFDGHMLHTVIYGPPGVGKTDVCKILVKIWLGLGVIKQPVTPNNNNVNNTNIVTTITNIVNTNNTNAATKDTKDINNNGDNNNSIEKFNKEYNLLFGYIDTLMNGNRLREEVIKNLQETVHNTKMDLRLLDHKLDNVQVLTRTLLRKLRSVKSKNNSNNNSNNNNSIYDYVNKVPEKRDDNITIIENILNEIKNIQRSLHDKTSSYISDEHIRFGTLVLTPAKSNGPFVSIFESNPDIPPLLSDSTEDTEEEIHDGPKDRSDPDKIPSDYSDLPPPPPPPPIPVPEAETEPDDPPYVDPLLNTTNNNTNNNDTSNTNAINASNIDINSIVRIVSREDFVGGYLGQTALKTEKLLQESLGKVLFIDEAYSMVSDEKDSYGREALTVLNRFMSEHPDEIIIIFAGYKELMEATIFKVQPGLKSRCTWAFEIEGYSDKGLADIFRNQVTKTRWFIDSDIDIVKFFKKNKDEFPSYGRDTNRLLFYCKICYAENIFDTQSSHNKIITKKILKDGLAYHKKNRVKDESENSSKYPHFYI